MEDLAKLIAAFAGIFALYKVIVDVILAKSTKRRAEYDFTKQFIKDLNDHSVHTYIKEKGFLALSGKLYTVEEIKKLLLFTSPSKAIEALSFAGSFIELDQETNEFDWNGIYRNFKVRRITKYLFLILYVLFCFFGVLPIIINGFSIFSNLTSSILIAASIIIAITCLAKHEHMKEALKFMKMVNSDK